MKNQSSLCGWGLDDAEWNAYSTGCGQMFVFNDEGPAQNGFKFCPYCGAEIHEHVTNEPEVDDDD